MSTVQAESLTASLLFRTPMLDNAPKTRVEMPTMANTQSAEKQNRKRIKQRARNVMHLSKMRTAVKKAVHALEETATGSDTLVQAAIKQLARAAQKGVIKKGNASRKISRLASALNKNQPTAS